MIPALSSMTIRRGIVRAHPQLLDLGHECCDPPTIAARHRQNDGCGIDGLGRAVTQVAVDDGGDAPCGREVGVPEREMDLAEVVEGEFHLALDDGAARDAGRGRHAAGHPLGRTLGLKAARGKRTLGHRVDLAIRTEERGDEQRATGQRLGVTQCAGRDVDPRTLTGERRQGRRHHDGSDVLGVEVGAAGAHAQALEHGNEALLGEVRVAQGVAGAVQADDEAVADEHVVAHALEARDILDAHGAARRGGPERQAKRREDEQYRSAKAGEASPHGHPDGRVALCRLTGEQGPCQRRKAAVRPWRWIRGRA
jgi:hypothetical protein